MMRLGWLQVFRRLILLGKQFELLNTSKPDLILYRKRDQSHTQRAKSHSGNCIFFLPALKKISGKKKTCFIGDAVEDTSVLKIQDKKAFALLNRSTASSTVNDQWASWDGTAWHLYSQWFQICLFLFVCCVLVIIVAMGVSLCSAGWPETYWSSYLSFWNNERKSPYPPLSLNV